MVDKMSQEFKKCIKKFVIDIETKFAAEVEKNSTLTDKIGKETIKVEIAHKKILKLEEENGRLKAQIDTSSDLMNENAALKVRITKFQVLINTLTRGVVSAVFTNTCINSSHQMQLAETEKKYQDLLKDFVALTAKQKQETQEKEKQEKSLNKSFNALKKNLQALEKQMPLALVHTDTNQNTTPIKVPVKKVSRKRSSSSIDSLAPKLPGCPMSLKVTKTNEGALLTWSSPVNTEIAEYVVSMKFGSVHSLVYKDTLSQCTIYNCTLAEVLFLTRRHT